MTFRILFPKILEPERLDQLLASGWFRMRRSMFTTRYLLDDKGLHTAVWARLRLDGFEFRPGLARQMRRIERRYDVSVARARPGMEERQLYRRYVAHAQGERPDELGDVLGEDPSRISPFDTWQVSIRDPADGDRLVAFSLFDQGLLALQSIVGVYDPERSKDGLGFATLLFEIRHGIDNAFEFHYPGYVVQGVSAFDYKRRVGNLDYRDPLDRRWRPLSEMDPEALPDAQMRRALDAVIEPLKAAGVPATLRCYPPFQLIHVHAAEKRCLAEPLFVTCGPVAPGQPTVGVTYDPEVRHWAVDAWVPTRDLSSLLNLARVPAGGPPPEWHILSRTARIGVVDSAASAIRQVRRLWALSPHSAADLDDL